jgi:hypothetical protein
MPVGLMACPSLHNIDVVYKFSRQQKKLLASTTILNTFQKSHVLYASACQFMKPPVNRNMCEAGLGVDVTNRFLLECIPKRKIILHGVACCLYMCVSIQKVSWIEDVTYLQEYNAQPPPHQTT